MLLQSIKTVSLLSQLPSKPLEFRCRRFLPVIESSRDELDCPDRTGSPHLQYFSRVLDPVLDEEGNVAFIATVAGRIGIWTDADGRTLKLIALQGDEAPGVPSGRFARFDSISLQDGQLLFSATLAKGGAINSRNDQGVWTWTAEGGLKPQLREGVTKVATTIGLKTVQSVAVLTPVAGSLAQGRSHTHHSSGSPALAARVTFTDGTQAVLADDGAGNFRLDAIATTGMPVSTYTGTVPVGSWSTFGFPAWSMDGARLGFRANMRSIYGTGSKGSGLFVDGGDGRLSLRVRQGDLAPDSSGSPIEGATFALFKDPVIGSSPVEYAFIGKLAGAAVTSRNDDGLWMGTSDGPRLIAREGQPLADAGQPEVRWKAFQSVALGSARGPLFVADLETGVGGVTKTTKRGLWGMYSSGMLWPLIQQGDSLDFGSGPLTVVRFDALTPANGAEGTLRGLSLSGTRIVINVELATAATLSCNWRCRESVIITSSKALETGRCRDGK
jgi:hypothetical protein